MKKNLQDLLRENFLMIPDNEDISEAEMSFLSNFFHIREEEFYISQAFKKFYVLEKKEKFQPFSRNFFCRNLF